MTQENILKNKYKIGDALKCKVNHFNGFIDSKDTTWICIDTKIEECAFGCTFQIELVCANKMSHLISAINLEINKCYISCSADMDSFELI